MVRASDSESRGCGFDPHLGRDIVSLSKTHLLPLCPNMNDKLFIGTLSIEPTNKQTSLCFYLQFYLFSFNFFLNFCYKIVLICLFGLKLDVPVNNLSVMMGWFPWFNQYSPMGIKCLAQHPARDEKQTLDLATKSVTLYELSYQCSPQLVTCLEAIHLHHFSSTLIICSFLLPIILS